jgi:uncharacterized membrane protein
VLYTTLKFVHILLAVVALGFNASYGILLGRAAREPEHELHVLRTVKVLDDRFANPAYGLLLVTGVTMVLIAPAWTFTDPSTSLWIEIALGLYLILLLGGAVMYTPTLRRQIAVLESEGPASPEYRRLSNRGRAIGVSLAVVVVAIVAMMVFKPTL